MENNKKTAISIKTDGNAKLKRPQRNVKPIVRYEPGQIIPKC